MRSVYATETWKSDRFTGFEGILFFTREDANSLYLGTLAVTKACLGERNDSIDKRVVISVHWLTGARFKAALSPLQVSVFPPGWGKANVKCILSHLVTSRYYF